MQMTSHPTIGGLSEISTRSSVESYGQYNAVFGSYSSYHTRQNMGWSTVKKSENGQNISITSDHGNADTPSSEQESRWISISGQLDFVVAKCLDLISITPNDCDDMTGVLAEELLLCGIDVSNPESIEMCFSNEVTSSGGFSATVYFCEDEPHHVIWET